nr:hypothetical protein [Tanacetum cinerariifolium]
MEKGEGEEESDVPITMKGQDDKSSFVSMLKKMSNVCAAHIQKVSQKNKGKHVAKPRNIDDIKLTKPKVNFVWEKKHHTQPTASTSKLNENGAQENYKQQEDNDKVLDSAQPEDSNEKIDLDDDDDAEEVFMKNQRDTSGSYTTITNKGAITSCTVVPDMPSGMDRVLKKLDKIMANLEGDCFRGMAEEYQCFLDVQVELDSMKLALDFDLTNYELREEEAAYFKAFNEAIDSMMLPNGECRTGDQVLAVFIYHYTHFLGQHGTTGPLDTTELFCNTLSKKELNHTIIALIPKVATPLKVNDYWPISCCNVLFKCISKIISNHMKNCLNDLVSLNQSAFVLGRKISDNILLTQELMHNYHLDRGPPRCAFKVIMDALEEFKDASSLVHSLAKSKAYFCNDMLKQWDVGNEIDLSLLRCPLYVILGFLEPLANKNSTRRVVVKLVFAALCYLIWKERNDLLFSRKKKSLDHIVESIISIVSLNLLSCSMVVVVGALQHLPFSQATIPGNPGRLVVGDRFSGRHVARETSNGKARMGYLPRRQRRAHIVSVKELSATVEGFPGDMSPGKL